MNNKQFCCQLFMRHSITTEIPFAASILAGWRLPANNRLPTGPANPSAQTTQKTPFPKVPLLLCAYPFPRKCVHRAVT